MLQVPKLDGVVPGRAEEAVPAGEVPVHAVNLVAVLLEAPQRVHLGRGLQVPHLDAAIPAGAHQNVLVVLAPRAVIQAVRCVESRDFDSM